MDEKKKKRSDKLIMPEIKTEDDRQKALQRALENIEKQFGKGAVMKLGENAKNANVPVVPTGSIGLDVILGVGGVPRGRIIEIYGPESSGKTTIALHCVAEVQKRGGICGYVDAEHALDPVYAKKLGVDIDELYISQPDDGEQALEICEAMVRSCAIDMVIVDSVAALTPKAEIEGDMGESHMGLHARLMSQALRKLTAIANKSYCTVLFINQLRDKMGGGGYGPSETTTGGRALKFYSSVRIDIRRTENLKVGDEFVGSRTKVKIAKNKVAPPFKTTEFDIMYGEGISKIGELIDLGVESNIVTKSGAWFSYNTVRLGQGRENAKQYLKAHPETADEIEAAIRKAYELPDMETIMARLRNLVIDTVAVAEEKPKPSKSKVPKSKSKAEDDLGEIEIDDEFLDGIEIVDSESGGDEISLEDVKIED